MFISRRESGQCASCQPPAAKPAYRGRLAPSPTGLLHLGHARTFWTAQERARTNGGTLVLRNEDIDSTRFKLEFVSQMIEDLRWFGFEWQEGPDCGGPFAPYNQSERFHLYRAALEKLQTAGFIYPCTCSRKDIRDAASAPNAGDDEVIYPGTCRNKNLSTLNLVKGRGYHGALRPHRQLVSTGASAFPTARRFRSRTEISARKNLWRERILATSWSGGTMMFRRINSPAWWTTRQCGITEVVRGADLLVSTARQILLYRALRLTAAGFFSLPIDAG